MIHSPGTGWAVCMKTEWDYSDLAEAYLKRPGYAPDGVAWVIAVVGAGTGDEVADVGAGVGHLGIDLAAAGLRVTAVEPNDRMRALGIERTRPLGNMHWIEGTAEATGLDDARYRIVSFGSSFNVVDRPRALQEARRISRSDGWFCCLWNHRVLDDPIQRRIEAIIKRFVPDYSYGLRREDHGPFLQDSGMFRDVAFREFGVVHEQSIEDTIEAWQSHATLSRQSGRDFPAIVAEISRCLHGIGSPRIAIPYVTRIWLAQFA